MQRRRWRAAVKPHACSEGVRKEWFAVSNLVSYIRTVSTNTGCRHTTAAGPGGVARVEDPRVDALAAARLLGGGERAATCGLFSPETLKPREQRQPARKLSCRQECRCATVGPLCSGLRNSRLLSRRVPRGELTASVAGEDCQKSGSRAEARVRRPFIAGAGRSSWSLTCSFRPRDGRAYGAARGGVDRPCFSRY